MTTTDGRAVPGEDRPRRRWFRPVRVKVLAAVLVASAAGLLLTGTASYLLQGSATEGRVDAMLRQELDDLRTAAAKPDPSTGRAWTSVEDLLRFAIETDAAEEHQTALGIAVGGRSFVTVGPRPVALESEPEVARLVASAAPASAPVISTVGTASGDARVVVLPVSLAGPASTATGPTRGFLVVGHLLGPEYAVVRSNAATFAVVATGSLLLLALVGWFAIARLLRPLEELHDTAVNVAADRMSGRVAVRGDDDVADVAAAFNGMLGRLEDSFEEQRRFLDDAGHELRTPLTIVQGHLELMDARDPGDVEAARELVLDELARMSRLVDDLTLLAKARRPDFVRPAAVELGALVDDVMDKVMALGPREWSVDARADAVVDADAQRLTQALLQLVSNAVKFTEPLALVAVGSRVGADGVRLWVRDEGPGIPEGERERIFERFGRASTGRGVEGSGLGLAIVCAIAEAHDGRVEVESVVGEGSTFTVVLPLERLLSAGRAERDDDADGVPGPGRVPSAVAAADASGGREDAR